MRFPFPFPFFSSFPAHNPLLLSRYFSNQLANSSSAVSPASPRTAQLLHCPISPPFPSPPLISSTRLPLPATVIDEPQASRPLLRLRYPHRPALRWMRKGGLYTPFLLDRASTTRLSSLLPRPRPQIHSHLKLTGLVRSQTRLRHSRKAIPPPTLLAGRSDNCKAVRFELVKGRQRRDATRRDRSHAL